MSLGNCALRYWMIMVTMVTFRLYCEEIDVGEDTPRQIASGLAKVYTLEEMQNRRIIVVCNLKPRKLAGFKSCGMVLCATNEGSENGSAITVRCQLNFGCALNEN